MACSSRASIGVIQADILVPEPLPWNGPRGCISKNWIMRADQSFRSTRPKMWDLALSIVGRRPRGTGWERKIPISSSKSNWVSGWNLGGELWSLGFVVADEEKTPNGRVTGVPDTTRLEVRPL